MKSIRELVEDIVSSIVDSPDKISITEDVSEKGTLYEITVAKDDVGKLIGKEGRVATALRTVVKAAAAKQGVKVLVNVVNTGV